MSVATFDQTSILAPVLALVGWTFLVLLLIPYRRFKAAFARQVTAEDFRCGESEQVPDAVRVPNRVFMNLLEMPVLFYVLCVVLFVTARGDAASVALAWAYVVLRVAHSLVYLSYNHVIHRFVVFVLSNVVVVLIWLRLVAALV